MPGLRTLLLFFFVALMALTAAAQKVFTEGQIQYAITVQDSTSAGLVKNAFEGASQTLQLKAYKARLDFKSPLRSQSNVYDAQTGNGFVTKQSGQEKYLLMLNGNDWQQFHKRFLGISYRFTEEEKEIAGYRCRKATGKLADGSEIIVYYTPELTTLAGGYDPAFTTLPGIPLEYRLSGRGAVVIYEAQDVQMTMVSAGNFDIPKSGYKVLEFKKNP